MKQTESLLKSLQVEKKYGTDTDVNAHSIVNVSDNLAHNYTDNREFVHTLVLLILQLVFGCK